MIAGVVFYEGQYSDLRTRVIITFTGCYTPPRKKEAA